MADYVVFDIETEGLDAWYGNRITCICAKASDGDVFMMSGRNEVQIISSFLNWLEDYQDKGFLLVTKNGMQFDIPFILARASILNIAIPLRLTTTNHFDLHKVTYKWTSLDDMAALYGMKGKTGNGLQAVRMAEFEHWRELEKYCMDDVELTEKVYLTYCSLSQAHGSHRQGGNVYAKKP